MTKSAFLSAADAANNVSDPNEIRQRKFKLSGLAGYPAIATVNPLSGKHDMQLICDPEDPEFKRFARTVADLNFVTFGTREKKPGHHWPIFSGDELKADGSGPRFKHPAFKGKMVVRLKSNPERQPRVFGQDATPVDPSELNGGDLVYVEAGIFSYQNQASGVSAGMSAIQIVRKAALTERIEAGGTAGASFKPIELADLPFSGGE